MKDLDIAQEFLMIALDKDVKKEGFFEFKNPICVVMSAFWELLTAEVIKKDKNNKIIISRKLDSDKVYLNYIYNAITNEKPKTIKKWIEYYALSLSTKEMKEIVLSVTESLVDIGYIESKKKQGIFKEKTNYEVHNSYVTPIVERIRAEFLEEGDLTEETIFLASLLYKCQILKNFFSKYESDIVKQRLSILKKSEYYPLVKEILDGVDAIIIVALS